MNIRISFIVYICILVSWSSCSAQTLRGISFFSPRSQSTNSVFDIVGWHPHLYPIDHTEQYTVIEIMPWYNHSVRPNRIAQALFNTDTLLIAGSAIPDRDPDAILADYFGLSPTFQSEVKLHPRIQNFFVTANGYFVFDNLLQGLYAQITLPFGLTKWGLRLEETVLTNEFAPFPAQYMTEQSLTAPVNSFEQAIRGNIPFGDVKEGITFGKITCPQKKFGVADMHFMLGWTPLLTQHGHVGFTIQAIAPTGSRPDSEFLFEPILGNGKHWELGAGFSGHIVIWEQESDQSLAFHAQVNITHLFPAHQRRSFDLLAPGQSDCSRFDNTQFGSRYILAKEFDKDGNYNGTSVPLINKTTLACDVRVDVQFDCSIMFGYIYRCLVWDIGYNGWIRTKEKINIHNTFPQERYALKGIQNVRTPGNALSNTTQSTATLMGNNFADQALVADNPSPVFITPENLNERSAGSPLLITHKLFTHIGYAWHDRPGSRTTPFIGIGGALEFEGINTNNTAQEHNNTLSQWGFWLQAGLAF